MLDTRTRHLYSTKRESKYTRRDHERSVGAAALVLAAVGGGLVLAVRLGLIASSVTHAALETLGLTSVALHPVSTIVTAGMGLVGAFAGMVWIVHQYRHRNDPIDITLPPITSPGCTFFSRDFVLGQGWTEDGLLPGDVFPAERDDTEILPAANVFIRAEGAFQNTKIEGASGTGKSKMMESLIAQAIRKYPAPPSIPRTPEGQWFPLPAWDTAEHERILRYANGSRVRCLGWEQRAPKSVVRIVTAVRRWCDRRHGGEHLIAAVGDAIVTAAYGGVESEEEALARHAELLHLHQRRPTVLVVNAKPEGDGESLIEHILRCAAADSPERLAQVYLVSPDFGTSIATFDLARTNADLASTIKTSINIIDGETDRFWTGQMTSLVTHLVGVMKAVMPGRITWLTLLNLLRTKQVFDDFVQDARALFDGQIDAERKNEPIEGVRVDHVSLSELERFSALNEKTFAETTAHILNFGGKFTAGDLVRTMAPEVPTYGTWADVIREGGIVGIDMPLSRYQDVSRAIVPMYSNAYVAAVMEMARTTPAEDMRDSYLFFDEASSYMTEVLERALSLNRSARMGVFLAFQIRTQFESTDTTASKTLGTICANTISFRDPDGISAELKSKSYGMRETTVEDFGITENLGRVQGTPSTALGDSNTLLQSGSIRQTVRDVPRFKAEVVQQLPQGHAIVMVSDGRTPYPARHIQTLRVEDIPWLKDVRNADVAAHRYVPPIPMCVLAGDETDWTATDRLRVLATASDPTRDDVFAMRSLWAHGDLWGVLVFTRTFAFVIEARHVRSHATLIQSALSGILKPGHSAPFQPTVVLVDISDGRTLAHAFGFDIALPFPVAEAVAAITPPDPQRTLLAQRATAALLPEVDTYLASDRRGDRTSVRGIPWFAASYAMRGILGVYRDVDGILRSNDTTLPQYLRAEWSDAIASDGSTASELPDMPASGPSLPVAVLPSAEQSSTAVVSTPAGPEGPPPRSAASSGQRRGAAFPTVAAVLSFLEASQSVSDDGTLQPSAVSPPSTDPPHGAPTDSNPEPAPAGSVVADGVGVLANPGPGGPPPEYGDGNLLGTDAPTDSAAVCRPSSSSTDGVGIPRDNPFDL